MKVYALQSISLVEDSQGKVLTNNKPFSQNRSNMDKTPSSSETRERHDKQVENCEEKVKLGEKLKTKLAFTVFGFVSCGMGSLIYTAAQDILSGRSLPTTVVLLTFVLPKVVCSVVGSFCIVKLSPSKRIALVFANHSCGTLLLALAPQVEFKLIGVGLVSAGTACAAVGIMPLTAYYHHTTVIWYTTGTGLGFLFAPLYYSAVTILACRTPEQAILIYIVIPLLLPIMYCTMEKKHDKYPVVTKATKHESVKYTPLNTSPDEELHVSSETKVELNVRDKVDAIWKALPFALTMITGYFSSFFTLQSVVTTLAFPDAPFGPRNHYIFYTLAFMMGNLTGRTYALILVAINPDCRPYTRHTWIFSSLLAVISVFLVLGSWYRFLTSVWIVLALMFIVGMLTGLLYTNSYAMTGAGESIKAKTELSRAFIYSGDSIGVLAAAVMGMRTEPLLRKHCMEITTIGAYCLTRNVNGLNSTFSCLK